VVGAALKRDVQPVDYLSQGWLCNTGSMALDVLETVLLSDLSLTIFVDNRMGARSAGHRYVSSLRNGLEDLDTTKDVTEA